MKTYIRFYKDRNSLYLFATHQRKEAKLKLRNDIEERFWNDKTKEVRKSHPNHVKLNNELRAIVKASQDLWNTKAFESSKELIMHIKKHGYKPSPQYNDERRFIDFARDVQSRMDNVKTRQKYDQLINWVASYNPNIALDGWTTLQMDQFLYHLKQQPTLNSQGSIAKIMQLVGTVLNKAIAYKLIGYENNPYLSGYKVKSGSPKDIKLEPQDIEKLWEYRKSVTLPSKKNALYLFLLSYYLDGSRFRDVITLKKENIINNHINFYQQKTDVKKSIEITDRLGVLLSELPSTNYYIIPMADRSYDGEDLNGKQIESINAYLNRYLKKVCSDVQIPHANKVSMHVARHTFAYIADLSGWSLTEIQMALGHSNIQQTRDYIGRLRGDRLSKKRGELHGQV